MRVIEYFKDVRDWMSHYPKEKCTIKEKYRGFVNALYAVAPIQWKTYNKLIGKIQDKAFSE
jgi:hypothetical protein